MIQDQNAFAGTVETNPPHTSVRGPLQPGFGAPPPSYSQVPGGAYPPAPGYGQPGFPSADPSFAPGPYPQMPYPQRPYPHGPYPHGQYPQGPYPQGQYAQGPYPQGPHPQGPYPQGFPGNPPGMTSRPSYPGDGSQMSNVFSVSLLDNKIIRHDFIRKVFLILTAQLLVTFIAVAFCTLSVKAKKFIQANPWMIYLSFIVNLAVMIALVCFRDLSRKYPWNLLALSIFTVTSSYMVGMIASFYDTDTVVIAVGITAVVCSAVMLFSLQTKYDFTQCWGVLFVCLIVLLLFGLLCIFLRNRIMSLVYASLGALLFTCYLAVDTQMLLGNKQLSLSPDDYIFAVLFLYLDILNIFLFILRIVGYSSD